MATQDLRVSTAGYGPQSTITGYVACEEKDKYPGKSIYPVLQTNQQPIGQNTSNVVCTWAEPTDPEVLIGQQSNHVVTLNTHEQFQTDRNVQGVADMSYPGTSATPGDVSMVIHEENEGTSTIIAIDDGGKTRLVHIEKTKPNDYSELTIIACLCNFLFGLVAITMSSKSKEKWEQGRWKAARTYGLGSMFLSLLAILTSSIVIFVLVYLFALKPNPAM